MADIKFGQWFMNSIEIIGHKAFLTACFIAERFVSRFWKETRIGSFIYRVIASMVTSDRQFKVLPLSDELSKLPLDVIAVARVVK